MPSSVGKSDRDNLAAGFRFHELLWLVRVFARPGILFQRSLGAILPYAGLHGGTRVDIDVRRSREARMSSTVRSASRYRIVIRRGMFHLLAETVELVRSRFHRVRDSGEAATEPEWSEEFLREGVQRDVTWYLRSGSWGGGTAMLRDLLRRRFEDFEKDAWSWRPTSILLRPMAHFIVAHEVAHVALGHCDRDWTGDDAGRLAAELEADRVATEWWIRAISAECAGEPPKTQWTVCQFALSAVAILFGMLELIDNAATKMGTEMTRHHPRAAERYQQFRQRCLALGVNAEHFNPQRQVEKLQRDFAILARTIPWQV